MTMDKTTQEHEDQALCQALMKHHEIAMAMCGMIGEASMTVEEARDLMVFKTARDRIDSLHARIAELEAGYPDLDEPEAETSNARLRDELAAARFRIMRIQNTATDARQRIEASLNATKTDGVHYADEWPVKGQGETP